MPRLLEGNTGKGAGRGSVRVGRRGSGRSIGHPSVASVQRRVSRGYVLPPTFVRTDRLTTREEHKEVRLRVEGATRRCPAPQRSRWKYEVHCWDGTYQGSAQTFSLAYHHLHFKHFNVPPIFCLVKNLKLEILADKGDELYNVAINVAYYQICRLYFIYFSR
jgi:hypothetical protein